MRYTCNKITLHKPMKYRFIALFSGSNAKLYQQYTLRHQERGLLIMRIFISLLMIRHGFPKMEKLMDAEDIQFYNFLGLGPTVSLALCVIGEFVAPLFIIVGYRTRLAAGLVVFTMAVAAFGAHSGDPIDDKELSMVYMALFAYAMHVGPGKISLDTRLLIRSQS
ncbi:MAG: DoxX family protein [Sphingomonadales bacterium]|nr:DoxX family protein [Sphingomonadales bacterium]